MARCPICTKELPPAPAPHRPFCSPRCKDIDLGNWLTEGYRVSRPMNADEARDVLEQLESAEAEDEGAQKLN